MAETLLDALRVLEGVRREIAETLVCVKETEAEIAESEMGQRLAALKANAALYKARCDTADAKVRELALAAFAENGSKQPSKWVTIRVNKRLRYDKTEASEWARVNAPAFFTLDVKAFEKAAPSLPGAPVEVIEEPSVAVASDLADVW